LPIRIARRVRAIERLPFIVGVNPHISQIYDLYLTSFKTLIDIPTPNTREEMEYFTATLGRLVGSHQMVIPGLARGFKECGKYMSHKEKQEFLDGFVNARIGIRGIIYIS
jgi:Mitochondrial branched-chain alpha-ketoacid dehydrogenase kinase